MSRALFLRQSPRPMDCFFGYPTPHPRKKKNSTFFVIKYFRFYLFLYKSVLWGHYTHYPSNPPLKSEICQAPFFFENLVGSSTNHSPPTEMGELHTMVWHEKKLMYCCLSHSYSGKTQMTTLKHITIYQMR